MNNTTSTSVTTVLNGLIETCKDGQQGYQNAAENVTNERLRPILQSLSAQRGQFAAQLQTLVRSLGEDAETSGSMAGAVHRGWIDLKAAVSSHDEHAVLAECERGEDSAVAQFRDALAEELPVDIRAIVVAQSVAVKESHDEIKGLRDRAV